MSVFASMTLPTLPQTAGMYVGRPPRARDVRALADVENHLHARRFRGSAGAWVEVDASACPRAVTGNSFTLAYPPGPTSGPEEVRHVHYLRTSARWLWLALGYQADAESTTTPEVTAQIYTIGGVLLERGVTWAAADGTLPTGREVTADVATLGFVYPVLWVHTGTRVDDAAAGAGTPSGPRLLSLDNASPRTRIEVRITATACRVVAVRSWELPEASLEP